MSAEDYYPSGPTIHLEVPWPRDPSLTLQILDIAGMHQIDPAGAGGPWYCAQDIARISGANPDHVALVVSTMNDPCEAWEDGGECTWVSGWAVPLLTEGLVGTDRDLFAEWFMDEVSDLVVLMRSTWQITKRHGSLRARLVADLLECQNEDYVSDVHAALLGVFERESRRSRGVMDCVYYLKVGDLIKIGYSSNLRRRLVAYPPDSVLLAACPGTRDDEQAVHRELGSHLALNREWFHPSDDVLAKIASVLAEHGDPSAFIPMDEGPSRRESYLSSVRKVKQEPAGATLFDSPEE